MRAQEPCFLPPMSSRRCTCAFWLQAKQMGRSRLYRFFQAQDREPCAFPISQIPRPWSTSTRAQARVVTDGVRSKCCGRAVGFVVVVNLQHARQKSQLPADRQAERVPRRLLSLMLPARCPCAETLKVELTSAPCKAASVKRERAHILFRAPRFS